MSLVMFASICDFCGTRGEEYSAYPRCRVCDQDVCPDCSVPGATDEETGKTLCWECNREITSEEAEWEFAS